MCINQSVMLLPLYRHMVLQREKDQQSEQYKQNLQKLEARHEADVSHRHQEYALSAAKVQYTMTPVQCSPYQTAKFAVDWTHT